MTINIKMRFSNPVLFNCNIIIFILYARLIKYILFYKINKTYSDFFLGDCSSNLFAVSNCAPDNKNNGKFNQTDAPSSEISDASDARDDFLDEALELLPTPTPIPLIDRPLTCKKDEIRDCQPPGLED